MCRFWKCGCSCLCTGSLSFWLIWSLYKVWDMSGPRSNWKMVFCRNARKRDRPETIGKAVATSRVGGALGAQISTRMQLHVRTCTGSLSFWLIWSFYKVWDMSGPRSNWKMVFCRNARKRDRPETIGKAVATSTFKKGRHPKCELYTKEGQEPGCSMSSGNKSAADLIRCLEVSGKRVIIESAAISCK